MKIGEKIKMLRKERNWTLVGLASQVDLTFVQVSYIERGERNPSYKTICAFAKVFDLSLPDFFKGVIPYVK